MIDLRLGNVLDVLAQMPSESVHCIVPSPPYWGLRAYGTEPQIWRNGSEPCDVHQWTSETWKGQTGGKNSLSAGGLLRPNGHSQPDSKPTETNTCTRCGAWRGELGLEPTPELFVEHIVAVMREARRVLRADGTLWLNIGDSYVGGKGANNHRWSMEHPDRPTLEKPHHHLMIETGRPCDNMEHMRGAGLKPKDLVGIPWRVAFALQADGWYLRMDCIWHKPNPMPESVRDRPTKAHEYIFLLSKRPRYFYDADAVREPDSGITGGRQRFMGTDRYKKGFKQDASRNDSGSLNTWVGTGRNRRSVWTVTTHPYSGAHFATFPPKLIEPCILAATSERGVCSKCGAPWVRVVKKELPPKELYTKARKPDDDLVRANIYSNGTGSGQKVQDWLNEHPAQTLGWRASCACDAGEPVPATVLDPFNGAGTTGLVALQHGRRYIGIDLKQEYLDMTRARLDKAQIALAVA